MSGKSRVNTGDSALASTLTTPPRSPIFMMPNQSESTPVRPSEISKAVLDEAKVESMSAGNTVTSPRKMSLARAMTKAMMMKPIQI